MINRSLNQGFSLIELMITVGIIGVLGFIAYPSYQEFKQKAYRADAMAQLTEIRLEMEQFRATNNTYMGAATGGGDTGTPDPNLIMALDANLANLYEITITSAERDGYMLSAVPIGVQSLDVCGTITIGLNGDFDYSPPGGGSTPKECEK